MEIRSKLTVTRGRGKGSSRTVYKGPMDKDNQAGQSRIEGRRWGGWGGGKWWWENGNKGT